MPGWTERLSDGLDLVVSVHLLPCGHVLGGRGADVLQLCIGHFFSHFWCQDLLGMFCGHCRL